MNSINYQSIMEQIIAKLPKKDRKEKLLLHACCAPCASYVLEYLTQFFEITVFFCNPNITDKSASCKASQTSTARRPAAASSKQ